jgi:beta-lactamase regulating signal transducer with metallopeptidase domain
MMPRWLESVGAWVWDASWHGAIVVGIVLLIRQIVGRRLPPALQSALWGLVAIRLLLGAAPRGSWSVFGLLERMHPPVAELKITPHELGESADPRITIGYGPAPLAVTGRPTSVTPTAGPPKQIGFTQIAVWIWLAGVFIFMSRTLIGRRRFYQQLESASALDDPDLLSLLDRCREQMKVRGPVSVLLTDAVNGPALSGVLVPKILLPPGLCNQLDCEQLRYVFLHELAHVRRHDVLVEWGLAALTALHWFNPAVWLAAHLYRIDRELWRDAMVLRAASPDDRSGYGHTLLKLLEILSPPQPRPTLALAMMGGKRSLKQRISMIANLRKAPARMTVAVLLVVFGVVAWVVLTDPKHQGNDLATHQPTPVNPANAPSTEPDRSLQILLDKRLPEVDFHGQGLADSIELLKRMSGANILVDWRALKAVGIDQNSPVTARLKDIRLSKALNTILSDVTDGNSKLSYAVTENAIRISTADELRVLVTKVYDIRDLLVEVPDFEPEKHQPPGAQPQTKPATPKEIPQTMSQRVDAMIKLLKETIDPTSWQPPFNAAIKQDKGQLIILQSEENHRAVVQLLTQLRETRSLQITTQARFVVFDPAVLPADDPAWTPIRPINKAATPGAATQPALGNSCLTPEQTATLLTIIARQAGASTRAAPKMTTFNGQRAYIKIATQRAYVADLKIVRDEQGKAKSYEPVLDNAESGLTLDLQGTVSANRKYVTLSIHPYLSKLIKMQTAPFSHIPKDHPANLEKPMIQVPEMYTTEAAMTTSVPDGQTLVIRLGEDVGMLTAENVAFKPKAGNQLYILITPHMMQASDRAPAVIYPLMDGNR